MMSLKMAEITVGMFCEDTRDGRKVFVTGKNPKFKTVEIQYEGEEPKNTALTTFNKHFQLVTREDIQEQEPETVIDAPQEQEPEKKERKKREPKVVSEAVSELLDFIVNKWNTMGGTGILTLDNDKKFAPMRAENGRQVIKLMWTNKKISLFVRVESVTEYAEKWQKINYALPFQCMFFNATEEVKANIEKLLQDVLDVDSVRRKKADKEKVG
ncbi:hypothetical protein J6O48_08390 [bacterium]|nr:hypothetical protein [bacterium]